MKVGPVGVAVVGAGVISKQYLTNMALCPDLEIIAVADLDVERAAAAAADHGIPHAGDPAQVLARDDVEIVVNLTVPAAHGEVTRATLAAGKHVFSEKPLALTVDEGQKLLLEAAEKGLRIGCAPDTILGAGIQSAIRAIDSGAIGTPIAATTVMQKFGMEMRHPRPEFLFQAGAGPLFDMGPYYLAALVTLFGPADQVAATARKGRTQRMIGSGPNTGTYFPVETPTHVNALIDFTSGPSASSTFSFDSTVRRTLTEVVGTEGTLAVPNPNGFAGQLQVYKADSDEWQDLPVQGATLGRGIGVVDMARAIRSHTPHRASGDHALHVLELMSAIANSADTNAFTKLVTAPNRPEPLPTHWNPQQRTL